MKRASLAVATVALLCAAGSAHASCTTSNPTYSNPLPTLAQDCGNTNADPRLLNASDGTKYVYYPSGTKIVAYSSTDLVNWSLASSSVFTKTGHSFYVPGVMENNNVFYLYYVETDSNGGKSIGVATSSSPTSGFADRGILLNGSANDAKIDCTTLKAPDGKVYLYWKHRNYYNDGTTKNDWLMVQELDPSTANGPGLPYIALKGSSIIAMKLFKTDKTPGCGGYCGGGNYQGWEGNDTEHPTPMYAPNARGGLGLYYLLYNGNDFLSEKYAIGYATSTSPTGPFTRATDGVDDSGAAVNPILKEKPSIGFYGPGSPNMILDNASPAVRWMLYRYKTVQANGGGDRRTAINILNRDGNDVLSITPTVGTTFNPAPQF